MNNLQFINISNYIQKIQKDHLDTATLDWFIDSIYLEKYCEINSMKDMVEGMNQVYKPEDIDIDVKIRKYISDIILGKGCIFETKHLKRYYIFHVPTSKMNSKTNYLIHTFCSTYNFLFIKFDYSWFDNNPFNYTTVMIYK